MRTAYTAHGMRSVGERFREAVSALPSPLREGLLQTAESLQEPILEVRIRTGRPIQLKKMTGSLFCDKNGRRISCGEKAPTVSREDTELCFRSLCGYSVHSHRDELVNGFITVKGGHRAGICGTAVRENERITGVRESLAGLTDQRGVSPMVTDRKGVSPLVSLVRFLLILRRPMG